MFGNLSWNQWMSMSDNSGLTIPVRTFTFDGSNDFIIVPNESDYDFTTAFSLSLRFKTDSTTAYRSLITKFPSWWGASWRDLVLFNWKPRMTIRGTSNIDYDSLQVLNDNARHHVVVTCTTANIKFYIDWGNAITKTWTRNATPNDVPVWIGKRDFTSNFLGSLYDIRVYNRELSAAEALWVYSGKNYSWCVLWYRCRETYWITAYDSSPNGNNWSLENITAFTFFTTK